MNILFYQHQYPAFGGIETVTTMLANAFAADGHNVAIVSFIHKDGTDLLERLNKRVAWHELPDENINSNENCKAFVKILVRFKPDKIIFQDSYANIQHLLFAALAAWRGTSCGHPVVVEHSEPRFSIARRLKPLVAKECIKRIILFFLTPISLWRRFRYESHRRRDLFDHADFYVILSKNYADRIRQLVGRKRLSKLKAIPNPTEKSPYALDVKSKKNQLLFVGSLIPTKGVHRLLEAWNIISRRHGDWELVIVGDGCERPRLEAMVAGANIPNVRFEGFRRNPAPYYRDASIFVMSSDFEGWPMVLGEAMQQGCVPVVYDSFAAASDIIDDGINGRVMRHFRVKSFVAAIEELMNDADMRNRMAHSAHDKACRYSIENIKNEWYNLLRGGGGGIDCR